MNNIDTIASLAAFFTMVSYLPQAIKTIRTRDTKAISFWMYFFSIVGVVFWLIFGIMIDNVPIILKNVAVIILGGIILWIKTVNIFKSEEESFGKTKFMKAIKKVFGKNKN